MSEHDPSDDQPPQRPATILTGSLGAGKTTLLNYLLTETDQKLAVVINDVASLNIDAERVSVQTELVSGESTVTELSDGCICCGLQGVLRDELYALAHTCEFDHLIIEASGISEPEPIAGLFLGNTTIATLFELTNVVTVVDAPRLSDTFSETDQKPQQQEQQSGKPRPLSNLTIEQIECGNQLILNKRDLVDKTTAERVEKLCRLLAPTAKKQWTTYGMIEPATVLEAGGFDAGTAPIQAGWKQALARDEERSTTDSESASAQTSNTESHEHSHDHEHDHNHAHPPEVYGISELSYCVRRPFYPDRFASFLNTLPQTIVRGKGLVWLAHDSETAYMLDVVGNQATVSETGRWIASLPEKRQAQYRRAQPEIEWHDEHGDREQRFALLGIALDRKPIQDRLDACLVTDTEWEQLTTIDGLQFATAKKASFTTQDEADQSNPY